MRHCPDCGERGERQGHQTCQYPGLRLAVPPRGLSAAEVRRMFDATDRARWDRDERELRRRGGR